MHSKTCMDKENPSVDLVCNNIGTCTPFVNSESTMLYICKCNSHAFSVGDSCYPKECVITDPLVSNSLTVCNSKGSCDFKTSRCNCIAPYTGRFCRSCLPEYIHQYIATENGFSASTRTAGMSRLIRTAVVTGTVQWMPCLRSISAHVSKDTIL